jgi:hypothetical protein
MPDIMEWILYDQLYNYLTKFELLSDSQFGFRKFHSTASTNDWYDLDRKMLCPRLDNILRACCTRDLSVMRLLEYAPLV